MRKLIFPLFLAGLTVILVACGPSGATPDESGQLVILQIDEEGGMRFEPESVVLTAGQKVRIVLENRGSKNHEFMVGRKVIRMADGAPDGFEVDFFDGIEDLVDVSLGEGAMLMIDGETVMMGGEMGMSEGGEMAMGEGEAMEEDAGGGMDHMGFMVMNNAGSERTVLEFTVPESAVGEWEMACFQDDGTHYDDGMRGKLVVVSP